MNKKRYISRTFMHALLGVMVALFVLTQSVVINEQIEDKTEQSESDNEEQPQVGKSAVVSHSSSLEINLDYQSYLVSEVFYQESEDEKSPLAVRISNTTEKVLKILFRQFISPNAP